MKKLRISVNEQMYDVTVEVLSDDEAPAAVQAAPVKQAASPSPARAAKPAPAKANSGGPSQGAGGGDNDVTAPIAGTVQKVFVEPGGTIEAKAKAVLLDAMKMDTFVYAPRTGTVDKVDVAPGQTVRVGERLFSYKVEA